MLRLKALVRQGHRAFEQADHWIRLPEANIRRAIERPDTDAALTLVFVQMAGSIRMAAAVRSSTSSCCPSGYNSYTITTTAGRPGCVSSFFSMQVCSHHKLLNILPACVMPDAGWCKMHMFGGAS